MDFRYNNHIHSDSKSSKMLFLEFIIVFLAIILGFFAENERENYMNTKTEKNYAHSLINDLKVDTGLINQNYKEKAWIELKFDSVKNILESGDLYKNNEFIYYVERYLTYNKLFITQDATYQELKSSGNFRLIKNVNLRKKISNYYNLIQRYQENYGNFSPEDKNELSQMESRLFNPRDLIRVDNNTSKDIYSKALRPVMKLKSIRRDIANLKIFYLKVANAEKRTRDSRLFLGKLKENANDILKDIKKEYDLK